MDGPATDDFNDPTTGLLDRKGRFGGLRVVLHHAENTLCSSKYIRLGEEKITQCMAADPFTVNGRLPKSFYCGCNFYFQSVFDGTHTGCLVGHTAQTADA